MDSLEIEGKEYVSAKKAAQEHSYTMDYIGQLIRGGKLVGKKVGRAWYVEQESLNTYIASLLKPTFGNGSEASESAGDVGINIPVEQSEVPYEEPSADTDIATEHVEEYAQPAPVAAPVVKKPDIATDHSAYHYPMLNYVRGDGESEDLLPAMRSGEEQQVPIHREYAPSVDETPVRIDSHTEEYREAGYTRREDLQVGGRVSYVPTKWFSRLPAIVAGVAILLVCALGWVSSFFAKEIQYEGNTAAVQESFVYDSIFK